MTNMSIAVMGISQLPKIEIPDEERLNDEEKHFLDAFDIIRNGYQHSQDRLRALSKAYKKLESIAQSLLKDRSENDKISSPKQGTPVSDKKAERKISPLQSLGIDSRGEVLMVDLTYDFDQTVDTTVRETSPVFGQKRRSRKNNRSEEAESPKNVKQGIDKPEANCSTRKDADQEKATVDEETKKGNEENRPPLCKTIFKTPKCTANDSTLYLPESQPLAKIGFTKTVYNIDSHKTPSGKRSKQSTLVLQPQTSKMDLSCSETPTAKPNTSRKWGSLFNENYRSTKKSSAEKNVHGKKQDIPGVDDLGEKRSELACNSETIFATPKGIPVSNEGHRFEETPDGRKEISFLTESPSQIDETARSLFDDDDLDGFDCSKDLLNTGMESPPITDNTIQPVTPYVFGKNNKTVREIASTSKASQPLQAMDSIDETFFSPAEVKTPKRNAGNIKGALKADCSAAAAEANNSWAKDRNLKRKNQNETNVEAAKELGDLGAQDFDWDEDISNDNWPPPKRPLNNSFDIIPEVKKKSPNYAYKGKVERNQAERAKLRGWSCKECENYYGNMDLPEEEMQKHMDRCSRHRSKYNQRYFTPKDFWNPVFPDATDSSDCSED